MPRTVITGGAGFIGSHLVDEFLRRGHEVVCIDNLVTGSEQNIGHLRRHPAFQFVRQDVTEHLEIDGPVNAICHLASPASPRDYLAFPIQTLKVGALGTHKALGVAKAKKARFLLASTSEVYGDPQVHPQPETYWGHVNPVGPRAVYDEAKRFAEAITMAYHRTHGLDTRIARIFNTYGPRMRADDGRALPNFISQALRGDPITIYGSGSQTRSFCYVADLIEGLCRLLDSDVHDPVNLGTDEEITIQGIVEEVLRLTGSRSTLQFVELPADDPKVRRPDLRRARERLAWSPQVPRTEGLVKTIDYFRTLLG
jgi:dTDP-glucose 4,6-dehydratase